MKLIQNYIFAKPAIQFKGTDVPASNPVKSEDKEKNVKIIKTGWMVRPLGLITCSTPFSGVVK